MHNLLCDTQAMYSLLEQEKKSRLKNGTLVVGKADYKAEGPDVS